ncbi:MAG: hypothetical protein ACRBFS_13660 [Aureispira sp.]
MYTLLLILLSISLHAQTSFSIKKEGSSILLLSHPEDYTVKADTMSSSFRLYRNQDYTNYYFRITNLENSECLIQFYSRLSPVFDSLMDIENETKKNIIIHNSFKKTFKPSLWFKGKMISYKISPMKQHPDGYYYTDIFKTTYQNDYSRYISSMKRVFVIDGIEHEISVYSQGFPYNKTVRRSRKAVCCVFEELVNNLVVELE